MQFGLSRQSALSTALVQLQDFVQNQSDTVSDEEITIAKRQLDLLQRASKIDNVMAEKIAESFGYESTPVTNELLAG